MAMNMYTRCIDRYIKTTSSTDLIDFLLEEKILVQSDIAEFKVCDDIRRSEILYMRMQTARQNDTIILLYFEWSLLPEEKIKITVTTKKDHKEFTYNY